MDRVAGSPGCAVTKRSGKPRIVVMRYAAQVRLRQAVFHRARAAVVHDPKSRSRYEALRARGHSYGDQPQGAPPVWRVDRHGVGALHVAAVQPRDPEQAGVAAVLHAVERDEVNPLEDAPHLLSRCPLPW
jgi:hypothetical protein